MDSLTLQPPKPIPALPRPSSIELGVRGTPNDTGRPESPRKAKRVGPGRSGEVQESPV